MNREQDVDRWKRELREAGWVQTHSTTWRAPDGTYHFGPFGAWQTMRAASTASGDRNG